MKKSILFITLCLIIGNTSFMNAQTNIIAHRGYWDTDDSAQNSISALKNANNIGVYGSEFDVLITSDGVAIVNHDDIINGLQIEDTTYDLLKNHTLKNNEPLPTLEKYLVTGKDLQNTQLILEIKPHKNKENEDRAVDETIRLVRKHNLENQVEYISFSKYICKELISKSPDSQVAFLGGDLSPHDIKSMGLTGIDYNYKVFENHPEWIKQAQDLGLTVNVWTVNDTSKIKELIDMNVNYITTDKPETALELLQSK